MNAIPHDAPTPPAPSLSPKRGNLGSWTSSFTMRALVVAVLVLLLLIPLSMVRDLIRERADRKREAESGISDDWGGPQTITGPVIDVPYVAVVGVTAGEGGYSKRTETRYAHFLPEQLSIDARLDPFVKHRGIYEVAVYRSESRLTGSFGPFNAKHLPPECDLRWDQARLVLGVTDLRSIKDEASMRIGEREVVFEPGLPNSDVVGNGLSAAFPLDSAQLGGKLSFEARLMLNGSGNFSMVPLGKVTRASCTSSWKDPSYNGAFLPDPMDGGAARQTGLRANWTVLHMNRSYPQEFTGIQQGAIAASAFGVRLMQPVDEYHKNERASKYGIMLIVLVFLVFFFVEVMQRLRIHPIQYLLVGFALCVFYALLIAISEHLGFARAYMISALAVIALVVAYARGVFKVRRAAQVLGLVMLLVFGFMFALIHEQDYALLFGSIGLFFTLALVMWMSARVDWSGAKQQ